MGWITRAKSFDNPFAENNGLHFQRKELEQPTINRDNHTHSLAARCLEPPGAHVRFMDAIGQSRVQKGYISTSRQKYKKAQQQKEMNVPSRKRQQLQTKPQPSTVAEEKKLLLALGQARYPLVGRVFTPPTTSCCGYCYVVYSYVGLLF